MKSIILSLAICLSCFSLAIGQQKEAAPSAEQVQLDQQLRLNSVQLPQMVQLQAQYQQEKASIEQDGAMTDNQKSIRLTELDQKLETQMLSLLDEEQVVLYQLVKEGKEIPKMEGLKESDIEVKGDY